MRIWRGDRVGVREGLGCKNSGHDWCARVERGGMISEGRRWPIASEESIFLDNDVWGSPDSLLNIPALITKTGHRLVLAVLARKC